MNKPAGMSSHDLVYMIRKLTGVKRIGHTGTLDPEATGVLPICIGTASRITEYLDQDMKTYKCTLQLGKTSDTLDIWGRVEDSGIMPSFTAKDINEAFSGMRGVIQQIPPKYSAVWVNGRRLYDYARSGQEVEIPKRTVYIDDISILDINLAELKITFRVTCSKGTYIRSICRDIGDKLGCGAVMCELVRERSGFFGIETAIKFEELKEICDKRAALLDKLENKAKHPRGRMNDAEILEGGIRVLAKLYGVEDQLTPELIKAFDQSDDVVNGLMNYPDEPLTCFGKGVIKTQELTDWFLNGGHIRMSEVDVKEEPYYREHEFPLEMREEYRHAYRLYSPEGVFLGVAFYNFQYKKLVADKVFYRKG